MVFFLVLGVWAATTPMDSPSLPQINDKLVHMGVFFCFAMLADLSISRKPFWFWKALPLLFYGAFIEVLQYYTPNRSFEINDWLADLSGIFVYYMLKYLLRWYADQPVESLIK
jgi:VanZ family protein